MKRNLFKRGMAGLLSLVMCLTALVGLGTTTAFAAGEQAEVYLISFPRSGDANLDYGGSWGHPNLQYMNGWYSGNSKYTTIRAMHSYEGNICYCIEPGTAQETGDRYTSKDETFWDNLPADFNSTISPYEMKLFIGRIMQYGYTGPISTSWRSQNSADAAALAEAMATQVLIWETIVGERDADFDHVSPGSYDAVKESVSAEHPLYSRFCSYYDSIVASVQRHSTVPSFMSKNAYRAQSVELAWDGTNYTATLTDSNRVLSDYSFSANEDGISFSVSGNKLTITAANAPSGSVRITASKTGSTRRGIITWTDSRYAPGAGIIQRTSGRSSRTLSLPSSTRTPGNEYRSFVRTASVRQQRVGQAFFPAKCSVRTAVQSSISVPPRALTPIRSITAAPTTKAAEETVRYTISAM